MTARSVSLAAVTPKRSKPSAKMLVGDVIRGVVWCRHARASLTARRPPPDYVPVEPATQGFLTSDSPSGTIFPRPGRFPLDREADKFHHAGTPTKYVWQEESSMNIRKT